MRLSEISRTIPPEGPPPRGSRNLLKQCRFPGHQVVGLGSSVSGLARLWRRGRRGWPSSGRGRSCWAWLLLRGQERGIYGESFRYLADSAGVHFGGAGILNASDGVSVEAGSFGKLTLREERSLSGPSYFLPVYLHDREHLRPPACTRRISSKFSRISR